MDDGLCYELDMRIYQGEPDGTNKSHAGSTTPLNVAAEMAHSVTKL
ncbi:predicted protein [Plenodomus lingam JN3]|uniref:Predicted protein n=1 Tax=Leptosphaeria maculans (strain JN3 / isolate v23.1.3 / race Av1-4-5-6-7-8) TaxID=985895 RepID=E4ZHG3_LEPMJ|nr:predicted protein [Plenodomus lingam JN3]CBX90796.1 predicted protein [Plenodomus lingam JN3]